MQSTALPQPAPPEPSGAVDRTIPPEYDLSYRDAFWRARDYEDRSDRLALQALLPPSGEDLLDLGAGFGRLADEFGGYRRVTLVDASPAMLTAAAERLGGDPRIRLIRADATALPFPDDSFDTIVAIRLLVHLRDPRPVFDEVRRLLRPGGTFIVGPFYLSPSVYFRTKRDDRTTIRNGRPGG